MNVITISREFGSGGRELGKRLADYLNYDYYDSEIISMLAEKCGMDDGYIENVLGKNGLKEYNFTFRNTIRSAVYSQKVKVNLLVRQKKVIEGIAALGRNCVIVGRNADVILEESKPFSIFVCADTETKLMRCRERASADEKLTDRQIIRSMKQIDGARKEYRELVTGSAWGERSAYNLTINTTGWNIKELIPATAEFAHSRFRRER